MNGLLVLDKPLGITSRTAVDAAQKWFRDARIGHTGTLDPAASGVLVLCFDHATRLTEYIQDMEKVYLAGIHLGARSTTDDSEGVITPHEGAIPPTREAVTEALSHFLGEIDQVPPPYSAARVQGRRAYDLARQGKTFTLEARKIRIDAIDLHSFEYPRMILEVRCGKGTYIRSLARDLGERLGCGAYLSSLRRTRVGPFRAEDALRLDAGPEEIQRALRPLEDALVQLPRVDLSALERTDFVVGKRIHLPKPGKGESAVFGMGDEFLGIGLVTGSELQPLKVFAKNG